MSDPEKNGDMKYASIISRRLSDNPPTKCVRRSDIALFPNDAGRSRHFHQRVGVDSAGLHFGQLGLEQVSLVQNYVVRRGESRRQLLLLRVQGLPAEVHR